KSNPAISHSTVIGEGKMTFPKGPSPQARQPALNRLRTSTLIVIGPEALKEGADCAGGYGWPTGMERRNSTERARRKTPQPVRMFPPPSSITNNQFYQFSIFNFQSWLRSRRRNEGF